MIDDDDRITCSSCKNLVPIKRWAFNLRSRPGCKVDQAWIDPERLRRCKDYRRKNDQTKGNQ